ncbi:MAG TPA: sugar phosphate isomerase/epimerase family protein [Phycisphaerae bacterium]|nr:sugar phosphate isomerase/epimerase family protein [Phycisphaerae bacterium]HOJ75013.1 sugar phosphate isomerase/epimerase family protein [Phycisphaerae bacterium]HOM51884.1 sugar phosphate isomerase/epimerase family protein [Phycisphaerae bacterium]HON67977.1 sugar phosphate isomerase/epimerase family protein [Phycisphaerae bacterium]HOQ84934.1 sugar phosphate isomerase/epimerase family protein [Phycisphaerae bacterium]
MANIQIGINMEFVRHHDMSFAAGVEKAAALGYQFIEPMVHWGRELLSEAGYFHSISMFDDPRETRELCEKHNVRCSGLSAHTPLCRPDVSVNYLRMAILWAAELNAPVVNTDEGPKPPFTSTEEDHVLMKYTLTHAARAAEKRGICIGLEPHQQYSKSPDGLDRICNLVPSPAIGINFDTGNSYLAGEDPYVWLARCRDRLVHLHAKDITVQHSEAERGKVTGTPVGCACGAGVIDWKEVIKILKPLDRTICFSVECGTIDQAAASLDHLKSLL